MNQSKKNVKRYKSAKKLFKYETFRASPFISGNNVVTTDMMKGEARNVSYLNNFLALYIFLFTMSLFCFDLNANVRAFFGCFRPRHFPLRKSENPTGKRNQLNSTRNRLVELNAKYSWAVRKDSFKVQTKERNHI